MRRWRVTLQDKMRHIKYLKSRHKNVILKLKCHFTLIIESLVLRKLFYCSSVWANISD